MYLTATTHSSQNPVQGEPGKCLWDLLGLCMFSSCHNQCSVKDSSPVPVGGIIGVDIILPAMLK